MTRLLLAFLLASFGVAAAPGGAACRDGMRRVQRLLQHSRFATEEGGDRPVLTLRTREGTWMGDLIYESFGPDQVHIAWTETSENFLGQGVGKGLAVKLLEANPRLATISGELTETNLDALLDARAAGRSLSQAARETPFFKNFAIVGFDRIATIKELPNGNYLLVLKRGR